MVVEVKLNLCKALREIPIGKPTMPSNLTIDDELISQVQKLGGYKTKKTAVNEALAEYGRHRQQLELLEEFGAIDYDSPKPLKKGRR